MQAAAPPPLAFEPVPTLSLIDSLYQSRQTLLFDTFAIFKSPSRPRTGTISEQPHSLEHIATANLAIGPHSFPDTRLYLCEWAQLAATAPPPPPAPTLNPAAITPALIARLNAASQTDPALAAILQKAASGQASPEELSGLARYIDDMRQEEAGAPPPPAPAPVPAPPADSSAAPLPTHPSLVLEFRELSGGEQFILPAHYIYSPLHSHVPQPLGAQDVLLSFFVFPSERASTPSMFKRGRPRSAPQGQGLDGAAAGLDQDAPVPVDMIVQGCGEYARECMFRAARNGRKKDEQVEMWWRQMISSVPSRTHVLFVPPPLPSARDATPPDGALDSTAAAHGHPASSALSRTASQLAVGGAATPGSASGGAAGQKRGGTPKEGPGGGKKAKLGGGGKKGPRASNARSVSNLAGSPTASPGPSSLAGSPGPLGLDDDPALVSVVSSGAGGRRPTRRAAASRKGRKTYNEDSGDDDFGVKEERG